MSMRRKMFNIVVLFLMVGASGSYGVTNDLDVSFVLRNSSISLHEPVIVDLFVRNGTSSVVEFNLGFNRKENLEFFLAPPGAARVKLLSPSREGLGRAGKVSLPSGDVYKQMIVLNERFPFSEVGQYDIVARVATMVTDSSGGQIAIPSAQALHLEIVARNPGRLRKICKELSYVATSAQNFIDASDAAVALRYIQDPVAIPYLAKVLDQGRMTWRYAVEGLAAMETPDAVDVLITKLRNANGEVLDVVKGALRDLKEVTGDERIKHRIDSALRSEIR